MNAEIVTKNIRNLKEITAVTNQKTKQMIFTAKDLVWITFDGRPEQEYKN